MLNIFASNTKFYFCDHNSTHLDCQDGMVLQQWPASAVVWGTGDLLGPLEAVLDCTLKGTHTTPAVGGREAGPG